MQEDEDQQKPACKQAGVASWRLQRARHQLVFAATRARTFSRSSRSSAAPAGAQLHQDRKLLAAFGNRPVLDIELAQIFAGALAIGIRSPAPSCRK